MDDQPLDFHERVYEGYRSFEVETIGIKELGRGLGGRVRIDGKLSVDEVGHQIQEVMKLYLSVWYESSINESKGKTLSDIVAPDS